MAAAPGLLANPPRPPAAPAQRLDGRRVRCCRALLPAARPGGEKERAKCAWRQQQAEVARLWACARAEEPICRAGSLAWQSLRHSARQSPACWPAEELDASLHGSTRTTADNSKQRARKQQQPPTTSGSRSICCSSAGAACARQPIHPLHALSPAAGRWHARTGPQAPHQAAGTAAARMQPSPGEDGVRSAACAGRCVPGIHTPRCLARALPPHAPQECAPLSRSPSAPGWMQQTQASRSQQQQRTPAAQRRSSTCCMRT